MYIYICVYIHIYFFLLFCCLPTLEILSYRGCVLLWLDRNSALHVRFSLMCLSVVCRRSAINAVDNKIFLCASAVARHCIFVSYFGSRTLLIGTWSREKKG